MARRKGLSPVMWLAILVGLTFLTAAVSLTLRHERQKHIAEAAEWDIDGPPCPTLEEAAFNAKGYRLKHRHQYADAQFARDSGHVSCKDVAADGGRSMSKTVHICQFTSPGGLTATVGGETTYYDLGAGQPATISVEDGRTAPRCVMAANFKLN